MKGYKNGIASMLILALISSVPLASFAEVSGNGTIENKTETQAPAKVTQRMVTYSELSRRMFENNTTLDDLKESLKSVLEGLDAYDNPYIYMPGNLSLGTSGNREGLYYQYAKPVLIGKANLEAQQIELEVTIDKMESTMTYQLQKMLIDLGSYEKQISLYENKIKSLTTKYNQVKLKYDKGLISKVALLAEENTLKQSQISLDKLNLQVKIYKAKVAQLASLETGIEYTFEVPVDSANNFSIDQMPAYLQTAKQTSKTIAVENAKMASIENEQEVTTMYKFFMFKSDLLDFERRKEAQKNTLEVVESTVHRTLLDLLNQVEDSKSAYLNAKESEKIARMGYDAALVKLNNKMILPNDLVEAELALNSAQLTALDKALALNGLTKRLDAFVNYGVYIEGGQ